MDKNEALPLPIALAVSTLVVGLLFTGFAAWASARIRASEPTVIALLNRLPATASGVSRTVRIEPIVVVARPAAVQAVQPGWFERAFPRREKSPG